MNLLILNTLQFEQYSEYTQIANRLNIFRFNKISKTNLNFGKSFSLFYRAC